MPIGCSASWAAAAPAAASRRRRLGGWHRSGVEPPRIRKPDDTILGLQTTQGPRLGLGWNPGRVAVRCATSRVPPPPATVVSTATTDDSSAKPRLAVFVSGGGSNFTAIHAKILAGEINAEIAVVVSDVPGCGGWKYAEAHNIPTIIFPKTKKVEADAQWAGQALSPDDLVVALKETYKADFVVLAGYLKLIPVGLVRGYKHAMVNIHPALLPSFGGHGCYGSKVHEKVVASGVRFTGPTVHFVDEEYDTGAIIAQRVVPVYPTDTPADVAKRVLKQEHIVYPEVVSALVDGRITFREDGIPIMWSAH